MESESEPPVPPPEMERLEDGAFLWRKVKRIRKSSRRKRSKPDRTSSSNRSDT